MNGSVAVFQLKTLLRKNSCKFKINKEFDKLSLENGIRKRPRKVIFLLLIHLRTMIWILMSCCQVIITEELEMRIQRMKTIKLL